VVIGDFFPAEDKKRLFREQWQPGNIFHLFCDFTKPPKNKYLLLICVDPEPLFFIINSEINEYVRKNKHLLNCQVSLPQAEHDFLIRDSYIDCQGIIKNFNFEMVEKQIMQEMHKIKGSLSLGTKAQVIETVQFAKTLSAEEKSLILQAMVESCETIF